MKQQLITISFRLELELFDKLTKLAKNDKNRKRNNYMHAVLWDHVKEQERIRGIQENDRSL